MASPEDFGKRGVDYTHPAQGVIRIKDAQLAQVEEFLPDGVTPRTKVAIVGFAQTTTMEAPFDDPEFSIWGMNQLYRFIPRASRWFEIHHNWNEHVVENTDHAGWLRESQIPIYMNEYHPEFPNCIRYPIEKMISEFGDYYTSSIAFMLALAISEGFTQIDLYGIDLSVGVEYIEQRPCAEYFIGIASAKGINVGIPVGSSLCKQNYRYGYQGTRTLGVITLEDLQKRRNDLLVQRDNAMKTLHYIEGALTDSDMWIHGATVRDHQAAWRP